MKTKNVMMLCLALSLGTNLVNAQKIQMGIVAGPLISTVSEPGNLYNNDALKTGLTAGLQVKYNFSAALSIRSGLIFEEKGFRETHFFNSGKFVTTASFDYLSMPLLIEGNIPINNKISLSGMIGPYFSTLLKQEAEETIPASDNLTQANDFTIKNQDAGWSVGSSLHFPLLNHQAELMLRYNQGLVKLNDNIADKRNKSMLFGLGFFF